MRWRHIANPLGMSRAKLAEYANREARLSRRAGAPPLSADSPVDRIVAYLQWNDPNGEWERAHDRGELDLDDAWEALEDVLEDARIEAQAERSRA